MSTHTSGAGLSDEQIDKLYWSGFHRSPDENIVRFARAVLALAAPALSSEQIDALKCANKVGSTDEWVSIRRELRDELVALVSEAERSLDYRPELRRAIANAHAALSRSQS